jgi:hypothetical protein
MSYKQCLANGLNEGLVTKEQYDNQLEFIGMQERFYKGQGLNPTEASVKAAKEAYEKFKGDALLKKRRHRLQLQVQTEIRKNIESYRNAKGQPDLNAAVKAIYARDDLAPFQSIESAIQEETALSQKFLDNMLATLREKPLEKVSMIFNKKTKKRQTIETNLLKAIFKEDTADDVAIELAKAYFKTQDYVIARHNKYGGNIIQRADFNLPQPHDWVSIVKAGKDAWIDFIMPLLNRAKMIDHKTNKAFMNDESLRLALSETWESITQGGLNKTANITKAGKLYNKRIDHRFLVFKDSDSWKAYQQKFGIKEGGILGVIMKNLDSISRDTAMMRKLGPDIDKTYLLLKNLVLSEGRKKTAGEPAKPSILKATEFDKAEAAVKGTLFNAGFENLHLYFKNQLGQPGNPFWARTFSGLRQVLTSAYLGAASILALTDFNWQRMTNQWNGLPAFKSARRTLQLYKEGFKKDKDIAKLAIRAGLIAEHWVPYSQQVNRFMLEVNGSELTQRLADATLTLSGLQGHTQAGRWGFGLEFQGYLADSIGKTFDELDGPLKRSFKRYGITAGDWDVARSTKLYDAGEDLAQYEGKNALFFLPDNIRLRTDIDDYSKEQISSKFFDMIKTETEYAVPSLSAKGRVALLQNAKPGTFAGELILSAAMFKQFPITLMFTHVARGITQKGMGKARYMGDLVVSGALYGAFAMELREILKGRNPTPLDYVKEKPGEYFLRALVNGGGLGLFGDYFLNDTNRYGKTMAETLPGPAIGFIADLLSIPKDAVFDLVNGRDTNITGDALQLIKRNTPGASIWYLRLIWERVIMETIQRQLDKDFDSRNSRIINNYAKETQQDFWWSPGETKPSSFPKGFYNK